MLEDHAARAVRASVRMARAVREHAELWEKLEFRGMKVGIGVHTGPAVVGAVGGRDRLDYTAIGAVINLAARLCAEASDRQILASGRLASAIEAIAELEDLGERALRGMARPVPVRNLTRLKI